MKELDIYRKGAIQMTAGALTWSLMIVVLLSVLFPAGAYLGVIAVFILAIEAGKTRQILTELALDTPVVFMLLCVMLSFINSKDMLMSAGGVVLLALNLGFCLVLSVGLKDAGLRKYFRALDIACASACIIGIYQFASGDLMMQKSWVDEKTFGEIIRIYSTLFNPNIFAAYLAMYLSFGLARFQSIKKDLLLSFNMAAASLCILLTYSRGGFIALFAAAFVLYFLKGKKKQTALYLAAMTGAFVLMNSAGTVSRVGPAALCLDSSSMYRLEIWKAALKMFMANPVFGHGIGTTWYYLSDGSENLYGYVLHSHNIYLQLAAETGIAGLFAFIFLAVCKVLAAFRMLKENAGEEETQILQGFIACITGIAVHGLLDAVVFVPAMSLIFMSYYSMFHSVAWAHRAETAYSPELPRLHQLRNLLLFDSKGAFKLFGGKGAGKEKYCKEKDKACQA